MKALLLVAMLGASPDTGLYNRASDLTAFGGAGIIGFSWFSISPEGVRVGRQGWVPWSLLGNDAYWLIGGAQSFVTLTAARPEMVRR